MTPASPRRKAASAEGNQEVARPPAIDAVRRELENLGLGPYEARVLLALLGVSRASGGELAKLSGVPRTSVYSVLEDLAARRLVDRLPGEKATMWACPGVDLVFDRLDAAEEERLREHRARTARVRQAVAATVAGGRQPAAPHVHIVKGAAEARAIYDRVLSSARDEVLVMNRAPYSAGPRPPTRRSADPAGEDEVNPLVLAGLTRGVRFRAMYEREHWERDDAEAFRRAMEVYHRAGVEGRVASSLPAKLAVADRQAVLVAVHDTSQVIGFPANLYVDHAGFAELQADAFERRWDTAVPV